MTDACALFAIFLGAFGWVVASYWHGMYRTQRWRAEEFRKLHADALKHWDETRQALRAALFPAAIKSAEKEFKS